jgi:hypothetical protein
VHHLLVTASSPRAKIKLGDLSALLEANEGVTG